MTKEEWKVYEHPGGWCIFDASLKLPHYKAELCEVDTREAADTILAALTAQSERDELRTKLATWQGRAFKAEAAQADAEALKTAVGIAKGWIELGPMLDGYALRRTVGEEEILAFLTAAQALDRIKAPEATQQDDAAGASDT